MAVLSLVVILGVVAVSVRRTDSPEPVIELHKIDVLAPVGAIANDFLGPESCAPCHQNIQEQQQQSHMANALHTIDEFQKLRGPLPPAHVYDSVGDIEYQITRDGDGLVLRVSHGKQSATVPFTYAVGSGANGVSFLYESVDSVVELRVSYYPASQQWDLTPGQVVLNSTTGESTTALRAAIGLKFAKDSSNNCMKCHSTLLVQSDGRVDLARSHFGVTCERCHGPGRQHVDAALRGQFVAPRNWQVDADLRRLALESADPAIQSTQREMRLCGECHGGDKTMEDDLRLARFHVAALMKSRCYAQVPAMLRCTDCHDPHASAIRNNNDTYRQVCLACHANSESPPTKSQQATVLGVERVKSFGGTNRTCPVDTEGDCIACHMPKRHPLYRSDFTLHRIGVHAPDAAAFGPEYQFLGNRVPPATHDSH